METARPIHAALVSNDFIRILLARREPAVAVEPREFANQLPYRRSRERLQENRTHASLPCSSEWILAGNTNLATYRPPLDRGDREPR